MKTITEGPRFRLMIPMVAACLIGAIALGCGSKDTSTGVAQLDDNIQVVAADNSPQNILQSEGSVEPLSDSSSSAENISEQTDEEVATSFAECLRGEGINVPDPELNADGTVNMMAFRQSMINDPNFSFQDPRTRQTIQKCVPLLQNASFAGQRSQEDEIELQDNLLEFAQCLRETGLDVGDPDFSEGRGGAFRSMLGDLDFDRDFVQEAMSQCSGTVFGNEGAGGPGGPPGRGGAPGGGGRPPGR